MRINWKNMWYLAVIAAVGFGFESQVVAGLFVFCMGVITTHFFPIFEKASTYRR